MSWGHGINKNGKEVGYNVFDMCNHEDCDKHIDRGLAYKCGGVKGLHEDDYGCDGFFCGDHLHVWCPDQLCPSCYGKFEKANPHYGEDAETIKTMRECKL